MEVTVTAVGLRVSGELRSLRQRLAAEEELRGRVRLEEPRPEPGTLGAVTDTLTVALGPGGVAAVFAGTLIAWIRHRTSDARYKLTRPDGTVMEVEAQRVRDLDAAGVRALAEQLARSFDDGGMGSEGGGGSSGVA